LIAVMIVASSFALISAGLRRVRVAAATKEAW